MSGAQTASRAEFQDGGVPVAYPQYIVDAAGFPVAGTTTTAIAAGTTGDTIIKSSAGRLCRVLVNSTGTAAVSIFDNATTHTGTIIGAVPSGAALGTLIECDAPAVNGIVVQGAAGNPALTVIWS